MFFKNKLQYYSLKDVPNTGYIFCIDNGTNRSFINFDDLDEFQKWYKKIPPFQKTLNEVITSDNRKFVLDLDINDDDNLDILFIYDFERHISRKITEIFDLFNIGLPNIITYNMSDNNKISYHFVVSNFIFDTQTCLGLAVILSKNKLWGKYIDIGIYKSTQCIRLEDSTKFQQKRWKIRSELCAGNFTNGMISNYDNTIKSDFNSNVISGFKLYITLNTNDNLNFINKYFKIRKKVGNTIFLNRIKPGYCYQCKRIHDKENAMLKNNIFVCWRNF